jgi:hypothetical protein
MIRCRHKTVQLLAPPPIWAILGLCGVILAGCGKSPSDSDPKEAAKTDPGKSAVNEIAANKQSIRHSVFSTNPDEGRDPFFPDSTRRLPRLARQIAITPARPAQAASDFLKLTGLWPHRKRPLALINRTVIAPGEEANITVTIPDAQSRGESRKLLVRCLEVRRQSVLISINGEPGTKELVLKPKL